jgi:hypothetical protein
LAPTARASASMLIDAEIDGFIEDGYVFVRNAVDW